MVKNEEMRTYLNKEIKKLIYKLGGRKMLNYDFKNDEEMRTYFYKEMEKLISDKKAEIIEHMNTSPAALVESLKELISLQHTVYVMCDGFDIFTVEQAEHFIRDIEIFIYTVNKDLTEDEELNE